MAEFRGDGRELLMQAKQEKDPAKKVDLVCDAMTLHFRELEWMFGNLGPENLYAGAIEKIRGDG